MGICKIGEKKKIDGKWYRKEAGVFGACDECGLYDGCSCKRNRTAGKTGVPIEDGGPECAGTIWVACDPPKPAKKPAPAKWTPIPAKKGAKV